MRLSFKIFIIWFFARFFFILFTLYKWSHSCLTHCCFGLRSKMWIWRGQARSEIENLICKIRRWKKVWCDMCPSPRLVTSINFFLHYDKSSIIRLGGLQGQLSLIGSSLSLAYCLISIDLSSHAPASNPFSEIEYRQLDIVEDHFRQ